MTVIQLRSGPLEIERRGEGSVVMVAHGVGFGNSWRNFAWICEELPGYQIVSLSRPGYGATPLDLGRKIKEQADLYIELLDALDVERCAVMGFSMGAPSAYAAASRHPARVSAVVLGCPVAAHIPPIASTDAEFEETMTERSLRAAYEEERSTFENAQTDENFARAILPYFLSPTEIEIYERDARVSEIMLRSLEARLASPPGIEGVRNDRIQRRRAGGGEAPSEVEPPMLVMYGSADDNVPPDHPRAYIDANPRAQVEVFEEAGHIFFMTYPRDVFGRIAAFLGSV